LTDAKEAIRAIVTGGLIAGILDITDALVFFKFRGIQPQRILQSIASSLLEAQRHEPCRRTIPENRRHQRPRRVRLARVPQKAGSYRGGWITAALGLSLHFFVAFSAAAVY